MRGGRCVAWNAVLCARGAQDAAVGCDECNNGVTGYVNCDTRARTTTCAYVVVEAAGTWCVSHYGDAGDAAGCEGHCTKCRDGHVVARRRSSRCVPAERGQLRDSYGVNRNAREGAYLHRGAERRGDEGRVALSVGRCGVRGDGDHCATPLQRDFGGACSWRGASTTVSVVTIHWNAVPFKRMNGEATPAEAEFCWRKTINRP